MSRETEEQDPNADEQEEGVQDQEQENASEEDNADESELDLPTALEQLEETSRKLREANRESAGRRKKIKTLEDQLRTFTNGDDDTAKKLGETMTALEEANNKLRSFELRDRFETAATRAKVAWAHDSAKRDAFVFAEKAMQDLAEDATEQEVVDVVKDVVKSRPYLLVKPKSKDINAENRGGKDVFANLNLEEIDRDFGISS